MNDIEYDKKILTEIKNSNKNCFNHVEKITKKQLIKEIRNITSGRYDHNYMIVTIVFGGYKIIGSGIGNIFNKGKGNMEFVHCENECTLKQAKEYFENQKENMILKWKM